MAVYVDDMKAKYGKMVMCHMLADSTEELLQMADRIGLNRKWLQKAGTPGEHFDIALVTKAKALEAGAKQITMREAAKMVMDRHKATRPQGEKGE